MRVSRVARIARPAWRQVAAGDRPADGVHHLFILADAFHGQMVAAELLESCHKIKIVHVEGFKGQGGQLIQGDSLDSAENGQDDQFVDCQFCSVQFTTPRVADLI